MDLENITRMDPHVHSLASNMPFDHTMTHRVGLVDCYNDPELIYKIAKSKGMDYVPITDHNVVFEALKLADKYEDVIPGCEFDVNVSGFEQPYGKGFDSQVPVIHVVVLGLDEQKYNLLNKLRYVGLGEFVDILNHYKLANFWAHPAYSEHPSAPMTPALMEGILPYFRCIATRNGNMRRENRLAKVLASIHDKAWVGESDSHVYNTIGLTWTGTEGKVSKEEFLERFREGKIFSGGLQGTFKRQQKVFVGVKDEFRKYEASWYKQNSILDNIQDPMKYFGVKSIGMFKFPLNRVLSFESRMHWLNQWRRIRKLEKAYMAYDNGKYKQEFKRISSKVKRLEKQNPGGVYDLDDDIRFTLGEKLAFNLYSWITSVWKRDY